MSSRRLFRLMPALLVAGALATFACALGPRPQVADPMAGVAVSASAKADAANDAVKRAILANGDVPRTIYDVRQKLLGMGGKLSTQIVANRGHDNPEAGSFSFFESYAGPMTGGTVADGELFMGFFTERKGDKLHVQQSFEPGLMIELIAWDYTKQMYNFWELVGTGKGSEWKFRGDSADILADVATVHMGEGRPTFGARLRCSGCHTLGGPIMKELEGPHNDWWTDKHKLALGTMKFEPGSDPQHPGHLAARLFAEAKDASRLATLVKAGNQRMIAARAGRGQSLKQELRSLFTSMEINLATDSAPFTSRAGNAVQLPGAFFVDPRLAGDVRPIAVDTGVYTEGLKAVGSRFAPDEANLAETRHAFVVPVRSHIDNLVIDNMLRRGLLDAELVADVLAVDMTHPVYSPVRASLMRYVPEQAANAAELRGKLVEALKKAPQDAAAKELLANLVDSSRTTAAHQKRAQALLTTCMKAKASKATVVDWLKLASQRRDEVRKADTAQNPRGTITEPGFRVIFPEDRLKSAPAQLRLDEKDCDCQS